MSCKAEHRTFTAHHSLTRFPQCCPSQRVTSPSLWCRRFDSSARNRHLEKELELIRGVEDHVEHIAIELTLGRHQVVHRKGDLGQSREKRRGEGWSSPMQQCIDWMGERSCLFSLENLIEEARRLVGLAVMG